MSAAPSNDLTFRAIEPEVLTAEETIRVLRLDLGRSGTAAQAALNRLVDRKVLRPAMYVKVRMFTITEIRRFLMARTTEYAELSG